MQKIKKAAPYITIFLVSFLLFLIWGRFDPEAYLIDDNRTQWFPVIERAYGDFFKTGKMPVYDFFQFKGFSIADQGYYGIMNPIMMISYILSHFTPLPFCTMTVYLALMFSLGNVCFSALCRQLKCNTAETIILTSGYSGISSFISFSYWYYVYNNYLIIPLMILIFLKSREKKWEFCSIGIILAFEILLGNVQYTCYHYMIYVIVCVVYAIFDNKRYVKVMFANLFLAGILSAPFLLMLLRASGGFQKEEFLEMKLTSNDILIGSLLPLGLFGRHFSLFEKFLTLCMGRKDYSWLFNGTFFIYWLIVLFYVIRYSLKNQNKMINLFKADIKNIYNIKIFKKDKSHVFIFALTAVLIFFVSFLTGRIVAVLLSIFPIIKSFRYLFKCIFVVGPVLAILTASAVPLLRKKLHKSVPIVLAVVSVIGLLNNAGSYQIVSKLFTAENDFSISNEVSYGNAQIEESLPDLDSYRFCTVLLTEKIMPNSFRYQYAYLRNFPTSVGVYSLAGYEMSISPSKLLDTYREEYNSRMFGSTFYQEVLKQVEENPTELKDSIRSNAIKYILIEKKIGDVNFNLYKNKGWDMIKPIFDDEAIEYLESTWTSSLLTEKLEENGIDTAQRKELNEYYDLIVLKDTSGLCASENDDVIPLSNERMDTLSFTSNGSKSFMLSFDFDKHLTAYIETQDGNKTPLEISSDENNHIVLKNPSNLVGNVTVSYEDPLYMCGFVGEIILVFLLFSMIILVLVKNKWSDNNV